MTGVPDPGPSDPSCLDMAILFARTHPTYDLLFWRAGGGTGGWRETHLVSCHRTDPEHVTVRVRHIGPGTLV